MKITKTLAKSFLPARRADSYKNTYGRVLSVCGGPSAMGAAVLAARGVLRAGAGYLFCAAPKEETGVIFNSVPEAVLLPLRKGWEKQDFEKFLKETKIDVALIGCGLSDAQYTEWLIKKLEESGVPFVLDAAALKFTRAFKVPSIITPHEGETAAILGAEIKDKNSAVSELAKITGGVAVLKGPGTLVRQGKKVYQNTTGNSALAKAGSGDALAGIITGLWAQLGKEKNFASAALPSAAAGVYLHGRCADIYAKENGQYSLLASEIADYMPKAFKL